MSKLPNHSLWARATTSAATSNRTSSILAVKSHQSGAQSSQSQHRQGKSGYVNHHTASSQVSAHAQGHRGANVPDAAALASMGGVSAPFYGPQPAAVIEAMEGAQVLNVRDPSTANSMLSSSSALPGTFAALNALSSSWLLAAPSLRNVIQQPNLVAPRAHRSFHQWSDNASGSSIDTPKIPFGKSKARRQAGKAQLLFDVSDGSSSSTSKVQDTKGKSVARNGDQAHIEKLEELLAALLTASASRSSSIASESRRPTASNSLPFAEGAGFFSGTTPDQISAMKTSPSRTPSPSTSSDFSPNDVGHRTPFGPVSEPPAKFAVTTSAELHVSSSSSGEASNQAGKLQAVASTSSASAPTSSAGALPPQASAPAGATDHWARTFNIPRSAKHHDFMFEHGAYGIPKRHPLSSIRSATSSAGPGSAGERTTPSREVVPSSKVKAAADMLAAAADFLAGPQTVSNHKGEFHPKKGKDALYAALAGGSTAEEHELRQQPSSQKSDDQSSRGGGKVHRMAIRGADGRIIKERLRSVQVGEDAYFLRPDSLGVADGVGGWASRPGADPALFSRLLMHFCAVELSRYDGLTASDLAADNGSLLQAWASVDPVEVMHRAWERCVRASRREGILGSSTALIGVLRGDELRIANMGDCVLMIIRQGEMMFRSTEQQHSFNFPVQLGMMGDTTDTVKKHILTGQPRERAAGEGEVGEALPENTRLEDYDDVEDPVHGQQHRTSQHASSHPPHAAPSASNPADSGKDPLEQLEPDWDEPRRDAGRWTIRVEAGDIIVVGSDGLMDNLFDEDIIEEVVRFLPQSSHSKQKGDGNDANEQQTDASRFDKVNASNFSPQLVSEALCSRAKAVSEDSRAISSPFQQRAMEEGLNYVGGKHDDISVVVCLVGERDALELEAGEDVSTNEPYSKQEGPQKILIK